MARHGREFDQITPKETAPTPAELEPTFAAACERAERVLATNLPDGEWRIERFDRTMTTDSRGGMAIVFRHHAESRRMVVILEPPNGECPSYAQTRDFNLSYWTQWRGRPCDVDAAVLDWCVDTLRRAESGAPVR